MTPSALYVFDAYGTLFDVHAAAARERDTIGAQWEKLSQTWRTKHLEYSWIHAVVGPVDGQRPSFWELAGQSLDFAIAAVGGVPPGVRARLLGAYRSMAAFPEVGPTLRALKERGARLAILSNGDPDMLADAVAAAGLDGLFDAVLSVAAVATFKPQPAVYQLVLDCFGCAPADVTFQSSNRWDVAAAKAFGFRTNWINRSGAPDEYPTLPADRILTDLGGLLTA
jgi:2-haloacid dehalogenase